MATTLPLQWQRCAMACINQIQIHLRLRHLRFIRVSVSCFFRISAAEISIWLVPVRFINYHNTAWGIMIFVAWPPALAEVLPSAIEFCTISQRLFGLIVRHLWIVRGLLQPGMHFGLLHDDQALRALTGCPCWSCPTHTHTPQMWPLCQPFRSF